MNTPRTTPPQRRALDNLARGLPINKGICHYGSQPLMIRALHDKGLMDDNGITELGLKVIKAA